MPESSPFGEESEIRLHFVQAIFSALTDNDSARLNDLLRSGVTTAEYVEAMNLYGSGATSVPGYSAASEPAASEAAADDVAERDFQAIKLLIGDRGLIGASGWADLFDGLSPERAAQLGALYDALPDGARAEYGLRYGRPGTT
jgi:hypothetical protein